MKVLLTGAACQLGQALHHQAPEGIELIATSCSGDPATGLLTLDLADADACRASVLEHRPDVDALLLAATRGEPGRSYCVGGHGERTNKEMVEGICSALDALLPSDAPHSRLITRVTDRRHDRRYAIDPSRISSELWWQPLYGFKEVLAATVDWYLDHLGWCQAKRQCSGWMGERQNAEVKKNNYFFNEYVPP